MTQTTTFTERVRAVFKPTPRGVVGLVDDLLVVSQANQLQINFVKDRCCIHTVESSFRETFDLPFAKTVFRAVLARIAALCNEHRPNSATPYLGEGEIVVPTPRLEKCVARSTCYVSFANTPSEQRLEIRSSTLCVRDAQADLGNPARRQPETAMPVL